MDLVLDFWCLVSETSKYRRLLLASVAPAAFGSFSPMLFAPENTKVCFWLFRFHIYTETLFPMLYILCISASMAFIK